LWIGHDRAAACLQEMDRALKRTSYPDGECVLRARVLLSGLSPTHGVLLPLAERLTEEAAKKRPAQAGLFAWMFHRAGYPEQASKLLQAYPDAPRGGSRYDRATDTHAIIGIGADIWDTVDEFHFAHKMLRGDGSIIARVDRMENTHEWAKAGVMIRGALEPDNPNATLLVTPSGRLSFQYRDTEGGTTYAIYTSPDAIQLPHWVRLMRQGNRFTAQDSSDGATWQDVLDASGQQATIEIPMKEPVHIGLAVTSHDATKMAEARISHVTTAGNVRSSGPFTESQDIPPTSVSSHQASPDRQ
jgi:hypothetical protein